MLGKLQLQYGQGEYFVWILQVLTKSQIEDPIEHMPDEDVENGKIYIFG